MQSKAKQRVCVRTMSICRVCSKQSLLCKKNTHSFYLYIFYGIGRVFHLEILNVAFFPYTKYFERRRIGAYSKQKMNERKETENIKIKYKLK